MKKAALSDGCKQSSSKNNYCIAIDWLEVSCHGSYIQEKDYWINGKSYHIERVDRSTAMFRRFYVVTHKNLEYAYIRQEPRLSRIKKTLTCIKLNNRVLYSEDCIPFLMSLIRSLNLRYHGVTRLDIAYDCNRFSNGMSPHRFIRNYVCKPMSEKGGMYLANSREYSLHGRKSIGNDGQMNYIQFGGKSCSKKGYIYDKTLELSEVKDKPWIRKMWEDNGLVSDDKTHVWRAEISINCEGKDLLNLDTGVLFPLHPDYLSTYENIVKIFHFYAQKVFDFRVNDGQKNRRFFPRLYLFDTSVSLTCVPKRISNKCDSGRSERACYNKLKSLSTTYVDLSQSIRHSLYSAMEFIQNLASTKENRYRAEQYKHYLDTFACCRYLTEEDFAYLQALEEQAEARKENYAEYLYERYLKYKTINAYKELE